MNLYHLHLNARNLGVSRAFYETYFGFRRHFPEASELFLANDSGFLLALGTLTETETLSFPEWFHIGFRGRRRGRTRSV